MVTTLINSKHFTGITPFGTAVTHDLLPFLLPGLRYRAIAGLHLLLLAVDLAELPLLLLLHGDPGEAVGLDRVLCLHGEGILG